VRFLFTTSVVLLAHSWPRPIRWTGTSTIFTAHTDQPLVIGRLFPSGKQFILPSPPAIRSASHSYEPPADISACPDNVWLFAYFPGSSSVNGIAVIWKRGHHLDEWHVKECWNVPRSAGIVASAWGCTGREVREVSFPCEIAKKIMFFLVVDDRSNRVTSTPTTSRSLCTNCQLPALPGNTGACFNRLLSPPIRSSVEVSQLRAHTTGCGPRRSGNFPSRRQVRARRSTSLCQGRYRSWLQR
jgi:hypothetical protein